MITINLLAPQNNTECSLKSLLQTIGPSVHTDLFMYEANKINVVFLSQKKKTRNG
jgi:hypothetical protein